VDAHTGVRDSVLVVEYSKPSRRMSVYPQIGTVRDLDFWVWDIPPFNVCRVVFTLTLLPRNTVPAAAGRRAALTRTAATDADVEAEVGRCRMTLSYPRPKRSKPYSQHLKLKYDEPLSNFAFKCNVRRYFEFGADENVVAGCLQWSTSQL